MNEVEIFKLCASSPRFLYNQDAQEIPRLLYKVWSGFTKSVRHYITQGRSVYSPDLGRFRVSNEDSRVEFCPSAKLAEQGRFTNIKQFEKDSSEIHISYSAISSSCGYDRDTVSNAVKEIIAQLLQQLSQNHTVNLNVKIGILTFSKGSVIFKQTFHTAGLNSSVDSAMRSFTGSSVATPRSSLRSAFRPNTNSSNTYHASNPNPVYQGEAPNLSNYYRGLRHKRPDSGIPHPIMFYDYRFPGYIFRENYTKKQACTQPVSARELLGFHQQQIREKKSRERKERLKSLEVDQKNVKDMIGFIMEDREQRINQEIQKRQEILSANKKQVVRKHLEKQKEREEILNETYDYFPFTHGDAVEKLHQEHKAQLEQELKTMYNTLPKVERSPNKNASVNPKVSVDYITQYPVFLQKVENPEGRRVPNDNIDRVIQQAEKRVEENKAKEERIKQIEQEEAEVQKVHDTMYYESMYNQKAKKLNTYNNFLKTQIEEAVSTNVES
jgi:hypothetical protein